MHLLFSLLTPSRRSPPVLGADPPLPSAVSPDSQQSPCPPQRHSAALQQRANPRPADRGAPRPSPEPARAFAAALGALPSAPLYRRLSPAECSISQGVPSRKGWCFACPSTTRHPLRTQGIGAQIHAFPPLGGCLLCLI